MPKSLFNATRHAWFSRLIALMLTAAASSAWGGTVVGLHSFSESDGSCPRRSLVPGGDGSWYGVTSNGGQLGGGTLFRFDVARGLKTIHNFERGRDSVGPVSLIRAANGRLYGTTWGDFGIDGGSIFVVAGDGRANLIHRFEGGRGAGPLMQASNGNFYGTLSVAGLAGYGIVYSWSPSSGFRSIFEFPASASGSNPMGPLVEGGGGWLYGVTYSGGPLSQGQIYRVNFDGRAEVLHNFGGAVDGSTDGSNPFDSFSRGADGALYGAVAYGGNYGNGVVYRFDPATSQYTILTHFSPTGEAGSAPLHPPLVEGTASSVLLTGTTGSKGAGYQGTLFQLSSSALSVLHSFAADGSQGQQFSAPTGVVRDSNGTLLGMACRGGANGHGVLFRYSP